MDEQPETPEDDLAPPGPDTPADDVDEEPAEEPDAEQSPDQSPARNPIAQAEYTRATQLAAKVRAELGLPKGAPQAEVVAALAALRSGGTAADGEDDEEELTEREREIAEREAAANARALQAELRVQSAVYGDQFTNDALEAINLIRTTESSDVEAMFTALASLVQEHSGQGRAQGADDEPADDEADDEPGAGIDTSEGDAAPRRPDPASPRRQESGVAGAVRGLFEAAGIASRPPRR